MQSKMPVKDGWRGRLVFIQSSKNLFSLKNKKKKKEEPVRWWTQNSATTQRAKANINSWYIGPIISV
jgi:hypothetical protein